MPPTTDPQHAAGTKLPLGRAVSLSYSTYFGNFGDVLRASWLWLIAAGAFSAIAGWMQARWMATAFASIQRGAAAQAAFGSRPFAIWAAIILGNLLLLLAGVSVAVAWHRRIILNERPGLSGGNVLTSSVWRYVWVGTAVCVIVGVPVLATVLPIFLWLFPAMMRGAQHASGPLALLFFIPFVTYFAAAAVLLRLTPLFPARAVGDMTLTFKHAWNCSRGNTWRLFWGILACMAPPMIIAQVIFLGVVGFPRPDMFASPTLAARMAGSGAVLMVYYLLITPIGIGFLSHAYKHLVRREPLGAPPPAVSS